MKRSRRICARSKPSTPRPGQGSTFPKELSKALSSLDEARSEYTRSKSKLELEPLEEPRVESSDYEEYYAGGDKSFFYWLKAGFAFTLAPTIVGILGLLIWIWSSNAK